MIKEDSSLYSAPNFHSSLMVPRADMPQIASNKVKDFLKVHGVPHVVELVNTHSLKPTQSQFNLKKG